MQISKTSNPFSIRPPAERWTVGENVYDSTAEMVKDKVTLSGPATYQYTLHSEDDSLKKSRLGSAFTAAKIGGGITAAAMALNIGTTLASGLPYGIGDLARGLAIGGGITAAASLVAYGVIGPTRRVQEIPGHIVTDNGESTFHFGGDLNQPVPLNTYAKAEIPEKNRFERRNFGDAWWRHEAYEI